MQAMQQRIASHCGRAGHPIFGILHDDGRQQTWLARKTGVSQAHVRAVKSGIQKPGRHFRAACAALLGMPEDELFCMDGSSASRSEGTPDVGSIDRAETAGGGRLYARAGGAVKH